MIPIWHGKIEKGKLTLEDKQGLGDYVSTLQDGDYQLIVRPKPEQDETSTHQYRYLFGVVYKYGGDYLGYTKEELHELMKKRHVPIWKVSKETGEKELHGGSTSNMTVKERAEFIDKVRRDLAEMGANTPDAKDIYF